MIEDENGVSLYFKEITNNAYNKVTLDDSSGKIFVEQKNGEKLEAEKLSAATYDQLYLSVRLALGEKLLKDDHAFFIMDDPFIKSDINRLRRQLEILHRISDLGWQIIYFSAKDEVKNLLKEIIKEDSYNFIETKLAPT